MNIFMAFKTCLAVRLMAQILREHPVALLGHNGLSELSTGFQKRDTVRVDRWVVVQWGKLHLKQSTGNSHQIL